MRRKLFKTTNVYDSHDNLKLNKKYSFDNFIVGEHNKLAHAASLWIVNSSSLESLNPLLIVGEVGLGKTHLVNAIGNRIKTNDSEKNILCISSEIFISNYVESVKKNTRDLFVKFYQSLDVLIIEDFQFFLGKTASQDIILNLFKFLIEKNKQIILTINTTLLNSNNYNEELLDCIKGGLIVELEKPDFQTRLTFLSNFKFIDNTIIPSDCIEFIAQKFESNLRQLEGFCNYLMTELHFNKNIITLEFTETLIEKHKSKFK